MIRPIYCQVNVFYSSLKTNKVKYTEDEKSKD